MIRILNLIGMALVLGTAGAQAADELKVADFSLGVDTQGVPLGWQLKERTGHADFSMLNCEGLHALQLRSASTSYAFQREVKADLKQFPILSWKWKVTKVPQGGSFRKSATDDQAAQLFLAFSRTRSIVYIWDSSAPEGYMGDAPAPPFMTIKVVVVRSRPSDLGKWLTETRNVYDDYRKLFGSQDEPPPVRGLRLQINSQHTKSSAESYFADISFHKAAAPLP